MPIDPDFHARRLPDAAWRRIDRSAGIASVVQLHGSACHGCALIAETSCEMRNDYLDRALVVPVLGLDGAAFFQAPP